MIVLDTGLIYALLDRNDSRHPESVSWYEGVEEDLATTPLVIAEADHLTATRAGSGALRAFRRDVAEGAYSVDWWEGAAAEVVDIAEQYEDLGLGLADASLVALAARLETTRIATYDQRHFRAVRPVRGGDRFTLLPLEAS